MTVLYPNFIKKKWESQHDRVIPKLKNKIWSHNMTPKIQLKKIGNHNMTALYPILLSQHDRVISKFKKKIGSHNMTALYPKKILKKLGVTTWPCYIQICVIAKCDKKGLPI